MTESNTLETVPQKKKRRKILKIVLVGLLILLLVTLIAIPLLVMPMFLGQRYEQEQYQAADFAVEAERITLTSDDELKLAAWRTVAEEPQGTVIILSGIQNPSVTAFFGYAKLLADNGWDSLLIEMRARSESEGDEIGLGMTEWLDVKAGVDFLEQDARSNDLPIVALGTSMGAGTVIIAAGELEEIDAVISLSAFSSWTDLFVHYMGEAGVPRPIGYLDVPFIQGYLGVHFGFSALKYSPFKAISKTGDRPVLLMHSTEDSQVPYSQYEKLLAVAKQSDVNVSSFVRQGDWHFLCYDDYLFEPAKDVEFSSTLLDFLNENFS